MKKLTLLVALLAVPATARAGGLARPNAISARGVGLGGAFSAVADDPTALHFNPAGLAAITGIHIMLGAEIIVAPRTYTPIYADDTQIGQACIQDPPPDPLPPQCLAQSPTAPPRPLPSLGFAARLSNEGVPSRLAFGIGVWNTFGGQLEYRDEAALVPQSLKKTRNAVIEVVPGLAYEVNDVLQIGAALRIGIGLFDSEAISRPSDAEMSATGVGAGFTLGVMVRPSERLSLGWVYRSPLNVATKGKATIHLGSGDINPDLELEQRWPQEMGLATAFRPAEKLLLAAQWNWHGWSTVEQVAPQFAGEPALSEEAAIPTDWNNSWSVHLGAQFSATRKLDLRAGFTYDRPAVTTQFQERQFSDSHKLLAAVGASVMVTRRIRIDTAFESLIPRAPRRIGDNSAEFVDNLDLANHAPGEHSGKLYTFELALQLLY